MRNLILIAILFIAKSFYSQNDSSFQIIIESLKVENKNLQLINDSLKVINSKLGFEIMILSLIIITKFTLNLISIET